MRLSNSAPVLTNGTTTLTEPQNDIDKQRFIISVSTHRNDSSSSDDECDLESLPSVTFGSQPTNAFMLSAGFNSNIEQTPQTVPSRTSGLNAFIKQAQTPFSLLRPQQSSESEAKSSASPKKCPTLSLSSLHKALLKHSHRREELEGKLRRQEKLILNRKHHGNMLQTSIAKLKVKISELTKQYYLAQQDIIRLSNERKSIMSQLMTAKRKQAEVGAVIKRQSVRASTKRRSSKPISSRSIGLAQMVEYYTQMLDVLEATFRIRSPFFQYFNLFVLSERMLEEVEMSSGFSEIKTSCSPRNPRVDPITPICPFYLNGNCEDKTCVFQHPGESSAPTRKSIRSLVELQDNIVNPEPLCPVCGSVSDAVDSKLPDVCSSVSDWHAVFTKCNDWTPYLNSPIGANNISVLKHHLHAVLTSADNVVTSACDFLEMVNFHSQFLSFALNCRQISSLSTRRQLLRESLSRLLNKIHTEDSSLSSAISCMNGLLFVLFHTARFEWEVCGSRFGISLIERLLSVDSSHHLNVPLGHPARWSLWFLRIIISVSTYFPSSPDHCPYVEPAKFTSIHHMFEAAVVDLGLNKDSLSRFLSHCTEASIPLSSVTPVISFCHLYVQFLDATGDSQRGALYCLNALMSSSQLPIYDNLLFPTAIHLSNTCLQLNETRAFDLVSELTNHFSMQTTFAYCFACLMEKSGKWEPCSSLLTELLSSWTALKLPDATSVYSAFRQLLCNSKQPDISTRNNVYLWMCFGLFSMIHSFSAGLLPDFLDHVIVRLEDYQFDSLHCPLISLLMHLGLALANLLPSTEQYSTTLDRLLFPPHLVKDVDFCSHPPSWFLELLQFIRVDKFSPSSSPASLFAKLVETYGFRCLKSLIARGEVTNNNESLEWLQSICSIARLEKPTDEEFWLLIAALGVKFHPPSSDDGKSFALYLNECLSEAVEALPLSCRLWRLYAVLVRNCGLGDCQLEMLRKRVTRISPDMVAVVEEVFSKKTSLGVFMLLDTPIVKSLACVDSTEWLNQLNNELPYVIVIKFCLIIVIKSIRMLVLLNFEPFVSCFLLTYSAGTRTEH